MLKKVIKSVLVSVVAVILSTIGQALAAEKVYTFKIQDLFGPTSKQHEALLKIANYAKIASNGRLDLQMFPGDTIVPATGMFDATKSGVISGHFSWPGYWAGRDPAWGCLADLPGGYINPYDQLEFYYEYGGLDMIREMYAPHGMYTVGVIFNGLESIPSRKPIRNVAELKGIKMRVPPGITAETLKECGAVGITLPVAEAFGALDKGVVDAADMSTLGDNIKQGLHEKAKYAIWPGFHSCPVLDFTVNKKQWDELPADLKRIFELALRVGAVDLLMVRVRDDLESFPASQKLGVELITWSPEELKKYRMIAKKVWLEWANKSESAKSAISKHIEFMKLKGLID